MIVRLSLASRIDFQFRQFINSQNFRPHLILKIGLFWLNSLYLSIHPPPKPLKPQLSVDEKFSTFKWKRASEWKVEETEIEAGRK